MNLREQLLEILETCRAKYTSVENIKTLQKTFRSHNITIEDWNSLIEYVKNSIATDNELIEIFNLANEHIINVFEATLEEINSKLDMKVDKVDGKQLSTNDFTEYYRLLFLNDSLVLQNKVDKVEGKQLSTNDFSNAYKAKLDGIESGAEANVIEEVRVNNNPLTITGKAVNIDLTSFVKTTDLNAVLLTKEDVANKVTSLSASSTNFDYPSAKAVFDYVNDKLSNVYKSKGSKTVAELNALVVDASMNGFVYNVTTDGTLSNGNVAVNAGDNVLIVWNEGTSSFSWDKLSGAFTVDLTNYYTKSETDTLLSAKANSADVYDKTTSDGRYVNVDSDQVVKGSKTVKRIWFVYDVNNPNARSKLEIQNDNGYNAKVRFNGKGIMLTAGNVCPTTHTNGSNRESLGGSNYAWKNVYVSDYLDDDHGNKISVADIVSGLCNVINASDIVNNTLTQAQYDLITNGKLTIIKGSYLGYKDILITSWLEYGTTWRAFAISKGEVFSMMLNTNTKALTEGETDLSLNKISRFNTKAVPNYPTANVNKQVLTIGENGGLLAWENMPEGCKNNVEPTVPYGFSSNKDTVEVWESVSNSVSYKIGDFVTLPASNYPDRYCSYVSSDTTDMTDLTDEAWLINSIPEQASFDIFVDFECDGVLWNDLFFDDYTLWFYYINLTEGIDVREPIEVWNSTDGWLDEKYRKIIFKSEFNRVSSDRIETLLEWLPDNATLQRVYKFSAIEAKSDVYNDLQIKTMFIWQDEGEHRNQLKYVNLSLGEGQRYRNDPRYAYLHIKSSYLDSYMIQQIEKRKLVLRPDHPIRFHKHTRSHLTGRGHYSYARNFYNVYGVEEPGYQDYWKRALIFIESEDIKTDEFGNKFIYKKIPLVDIVNGLADAPVLRDTFFKQVDNGTAYDDLDGIMVGGAVQNIVDPACNIAVSNGVSGMYVSGYTMNSQCYRGDIIYNVPTEGSGGELLYNFNHVPNKYDMLRNYWAPFVFSGYVDISFLNFSRRKSTAALYVGRYPNHLLDEACIKYRFAVVANDYDSITDGSIWERKYSQYPKRMYIYVGQYLFDCVEADEDYGDETDNNVAIIRFGISR